MLSSLEASEIPFQLGVSPCKLELTPEGFLKLLVSGTYIELDHKLVGDFEARMLTLQLSSTLRRSYDLNHRLAQLQSEAQDIVDFTASKIELKFNQFINRLRFKRAIATGIAETPLTVLALVRLQEELAQPEVAASFPPEELSNIIPNIRLLLASQVNYYRNLIEFASQLGLKIS